MPLKTEPLEEPVINLTSMLDIVMLLIIFFMVATKFTEEERQTSIQVPTVSENIAMTGQPDEIIVNITLDGKISVQGQAHTLETLKPFLEAARESYPGQAVVIRGDRKCELQIVTDAISTCTAAGIRKVSLAHSPNLKGI